MRLLPLLLLVIACADPAPVSPSSDGRSGQGPASGDSPARPAPEAAARDETPEAEDWAPAPRAEALVVFPEPSGPAEAQCTRRGDVEVCRREASGEAEVVIERAGTPLAAWAVAQGVQAGPFAAFAGDLDRDGGQDHLVAVLTAVSNGLGVHYWTVYVLPDGAAAPAYSFEVEDFGARGQSVAVHDGRDVVWATDWVAAPDPSGDRVEGTYLLGRPVVLASGGLRPATGLPLRARRLLRGFDPESEAGAAGWLAARGSEVVRADLALTGCTPSDETVTVRSTRPGEDAFGSQHTRLTLADGRVLTLGYSADDNAPIRHVGDAASGRLFPTDYRPPGLRLDGGTFRLTTCADGGWTKARVLWLE